MESSLISFISEVQLQLKDSKYRSDQILRVLGLYAEDKISRDLCIQIVFSLLKSNPHLQQRFASIIECVPPSTSRGSCLMNDPYINCVVQLQLWPGALVSFLKRIREAMQRKSTIIDAFVDLEHVAPTSEPFWCLLDLFRPIINTNHFMQLIYDGCVDQSLIPLHIHPYELPSQADKDPSGIKHTTIIDSELLSTYRRDIQQAIRPIGRIRNGSYGLLERGFVDTQCSGRSIGNFAALNDRWTTSASGAEGNFAYAYKNQYEERLFENEDERVQVDVRICRLKTSIEILQRIMDTLNNNRFSGNVRNLILSNLRSLDYLSLQEIYGDHNVDLVVDAICSRPLEIIPLVLERFSAARARLLEYRHGKEADYHEVNKRNCKRSLDVQKHDGHSSRLDNNSMRHLEGGQKFELEYDLAASEAVINIIEQVAASVSQKAYSESGPTILNEFVRPFIFGTFESDPAVTSQNQNQSQTQTQNQNQPQPQQQPSQGVMNIVQQPPPVNLIPQQMPVQMQPGVAMNYSGVPVQHFRPTDLTRTENDDLEAKYISVELFRILHIFWQIVASIEPVWRDSSENSGSKDGEENEAQGLQVAQLLGLVSENHRRSGFVRDAIMESVPSFIISGKHSPCEQQFDLPANAPLPNIEALKKGVMAFLKQAHQIVGTKNGVFPGIVRAFTASSDPVKYRSEAKRVLGGTLHVGCVLERTQGKVVMGKETGERLKVTFSAEVPKRVRMRQKVVIKNIPQVGPLMVSDRVLKDRQDRGITGRVTALQPERMRPASNNLTFRIGFDGMELMSTGDDWLRKA